MYPEQLRYMQEVKRALDAKGHGLLEMPTGTGKTVTLLSLITSYQLQHPEVGKLVYCTRTVPEMEKVLEELKAIEAHRDELYGADRGDQPLALGLSSRRNLCVHPRISAMPERGAVDHECRMLTASWQRERAGRADSPTQASEASTVPRDCSAFAAPEGRVLALDGADYVATLLDASHGGALPLAALYALRHGALFYAAKKWVLP